jgi:hypothetical protein
MKKRSRGQVVRKPLKIFGGSFLKAEDKLNSGSDDEWITPAVRVCSSHRCQTSCRLRTAPKLLSFRLPFKARLMHPEGIPAGRPTPGACSIFCIHCAFCCPSAADANIASAGATTQHALHDGGGIIIVPKVKLSLYLIKHHSMKTYGGVEV